jgi:hypothetical protein
MQYQIHQIVLFLTNHDDSHRCKIETIRPCERGGTDGTLFSVLGEGFYGMLQLSDDFRESFHQRNSFFLWQTVLHLCKSLSELGDLFSDGSVV